MGSDAHIFLFDYQHFMTSTVPKFKMLLREGQLDETFIECYRFLTSHEYINHISCHGTDIDRHCHYLAADFSYDHEPKDQWTASWSQRACKSKHCPDRPSCPFYYHNTELDPESLNALFEQVVVDSCLYESQFVGRSMSPMRYHADVKKQLGWQLSTSLLNLLSRLEYRGLVIGYQWANSDGIHGWLTPEEIPQFYEELTQLELVPVPDGLDQMKHYIIPKQGYHVPAGYTYAQLTLAFIKNFAYIACSRNLGVLWGNDVCTLRDDEDTHAIAR
jgi:hypothetical protein